MAKIYNFPSCSKFYKLNEDYKSRCSMRSSELELETAVINRFCISEEPEDTSRKLSNNNSNNREEYPTTVKNSSIPLRMPNPKIQFGSITVELVESQPISKKKLNLLYLGIFVCLGLIFLILFSTFVFNLKIFLSTLIVLATLAIIEIVLYLMTIHYENINSKANNSDLWKSW